MTTSVDCALCQKPVEPGAEEALRHVHRVHLDEAPFRCALCRFKSRRPTRAGFKAVERHVKTMHKVKAAAAFVLDRREELRPRSDSLARKCFGKSTTSSGP